MILKRRSTPAFERSFSPPPSLRSLGMLNQDDLDRWFVHTVSDGSAELRRSAVLKWAALSRTLSPAAESSLLAVANDSDRSVRAAVLRSVGLLFLRMAPLDVTEIVARWSCADDPNVRLMLAHALATSVCAPGALTATSLLLKDPDERVARRALIAAVRRHLVEPPVDGAMDDFTYDGHDVTYDGHDVTYDGHDATYDGHDATYDGDVVGGGRSNVA